ncbi:MAG: M48 family metallopeptidase [Candidatus Omnitrophica bacterium]|nr:M48 family metallopeptidase [Candidatus Omnitrophota bacterium]
MQGRQPTAKEYNSIKIKLKFLDLLIGALYLILFQFFLSFQLKESVFNITPNFYFAFTIYLAAFSLFYYAATFPLNLYSSFVLEHKFKLSNQGFLDWFKDDIKGGILSLFIFLAFMQVLYLLLRHFSATWWIWIAFVWFIATVIFAKIAPIVIVPLFFKYSPVESSLKTKIFELSKKCGMKILDVYKIDFSKKTKKLNAALVGLGKTRRVILADNLVEEFTDREIMGVMAHEFAHHKLFHMWKIISFAFLATFISFYVLYLLSIKIVVLFKADGIYDMAIFPFFALVLSLTGFFTMPAKNAFSRRLERSADIFALEVTKDRDSFISLMNKLSSRNLADPNPSKLVKFLFYDHPPISERIELAENYKPL